MAKKPKWPKDRLWPKAITPPPRIRKERRRGAYLRASSDGAPADLLNLVLWDMQRRWSAALSKRRRGKAKRKN